MLGPWMMSLVNAFQMILKYVGINLSSGYIRVTQHQLHRPQIGAAFKKMGGETVPQFMRREFLAQTCRAAVRREHLPNPNSAQKPSEPVKENSCCRCGAIAAFHQNGA